MPAGSGFGAFSASGAIRRIVRQPWQSISMRYKVHQSRGDEKSGGSNEE
jgi:hypothetical protein